MDQVLCLFTKTRFALIVVLMLYPNFIQSQRTDYRKQDLSLWTWLQVEKKVGNAQYIEFQYQARFDQYISQFSRSNLYFIYGNNFRSHFNFEFLYQLNENYKKDQHTFYSGLTYKQNILPHTSIAIRTAVQNTRNYFTGDYKSDKPYTEWRNRVRLTYKINNPFSFSLSVEPYILFKPVRSPYFSRIRYVGQVTYKYNKYQKFTLFYLIQPDAISYSIPKTNYVIGVVYHLTLPNKIKGYSKLFRQKNKTRNKNKDDENDADENPEQNDNN